LKSPRNPPIYSTLKRRFCTLELQRMGFVRSGSFMVRLGMCRSELARATSSDGQSWRVTPLVRHWRPGGRR